MKLKKLLVQNYKCIEDSNEIAIDHVTCLVGKNEAGKSALLEALYKLNPVEADKADFHEEDYPRRHVSNHRDKKSWDPANVLTTIWEIDDSFLKFMGETYGPKAFSNRELTITKGYGNILEWDIGIDEHSVADYFLESSSLETEEKAPLCGARSIEDLIRQLGSMSTPSSNQQRFLNQLKNQFPSHSAKETIINVLRSRLPTFLYFSDYNKLAGRVSIDDLLERQQSNNLPFDQQIFLALLDLAGSSPENIVNIRQSERLIMELEAVSNRLTDEIFEYWSQNEHLDVQFRFDAAKPDDPPPFNKGFVFSTRIHNRRHRVTLDIEERSAGFIWFFSFLAWFSQVKKNYGDNLFILLDEPGLNLHGKAQQDLLRYINERLRPNYQVIFSTHSPFMIDADNIFSLRTVDDVVEQEQKNGKSVEKVLGTKVKQRILSADRGTLSALQGTIGFDAVAMMLRSRYILVVAGSDQVNYINWFSRQLAGKDREALDLRWSVVASGGVNKVASFATLFVGCGLKTAVLMEYDEDRKEIVDKLEESGLLKNGHLLKMSSYLQRNDADISDLMGRAFYIHLVNGCLMLNEKFKLPKKKPSDAPDRVIDEVSAYFKTLPPGISQMEYCKPVDYLLQIKPREIDNVPGLNEALDRFEKIFHDLNRLIKS